MTGKIILKWDFPVSILLSRIENEKVQWSMCHELHYPVRWSCSYESYAFCSISFPGAEKWRLVSSAALNAVRMATVERPDNSAVTQLRVSQDADAPITRTIPMWDPLDRRTWVQTRSSWGAAGRWDGSRSPVFIFASSTREANPIFIHITPQNTRH